MRNPYHQKIRESAHQLDHPLQGLLSKSLGNSDLFSQGKFSHTFERIPFELLSWRSRLLKLQSMKVSENHRFQNIRINQNRVLLQATSLRTASLSESAKLPFEELSSQSFQKSKQKGTANIFSSIDHFKHRSQDDFRGDLQTVVVLPRPVQSNQTNATQPSQLRSQLAIEFQNMRCSAIQVLCNRMHGVSAYGLIRNDNDPNLTRKRLPAQSSVEALARTPLSKMSEEQFVELANNNDKEYSMALTAIVEGVQSSEDLQALLRLVRCTAIRLLNDGNGNYVLQAAIRSLSEVREPLIGYCSKHFEALIHVDCATRVMQELAVHSASFRQFVLSWFSGRLSNYFKEAAPMYLLGRTIKAVSSSQELEAIRHDILDKRIWMKKTKYMNRILLEYLEVCSDEDLSMVWTFLNFKCNLLKCFVDKIDTLILAVFVKRQHREVFDLLVLGIRSNLLELITSNFFSYFLFKLFIVSASTKHAPAVESPLNKGPGRQADLRMLASTQENRATSSIHSNEERKDKQVICNIKAKIYEELIHLNHMCLDEILRDSVNTHHFLFCMLITLPESHPQVLAKISGAICKETYNNGFILQFISREQTRLLETR